MIPCVNMVRYVVNFNRHVLFYGRRMLQYDLVFDLIENRTSTFQFEIII